jgi:hypothetical protein
MLHFENENENENEDALRKVGMSQVHRVDPRPRSGFL